MAAHDNEGPDELNLNYLRVAKLWSCFSAICNDDRKTGQLENLLKIVASAFHRLLSEAYVIWWDSQEKAREIVAICRDVQIIDVCWWKQWNKNLKFREHGTYRGRLWYLG